MPSLPENPTPGCVEGAMEEIKLGRLRQMCRRGTLELDVLLARWMDKGYPSSSPEERSIFLELLELEDDELQAILMGHQQAAPSVAELSRKIRDCKPG